MRNFLILFCLLSSLIWSNSLERHKWKLKEDNLEQLFALYTLYPETEEGQEALKKAWSLLTGGKIKGEIPPTLPEIGKIVDAVISPDRKSLPEIPPKMRSLLKELSSSLHTAKLKGTYIHTLEELQSLPDEEVNISKALGLSFVEAGLLKPEEAEDLELYLDLTALRAQAEMKNNPTPYEVIETLNTLIFEKMYVRFPPQSLMEERVDNYTFLPDVLDSRRGVCLGVSTLYLALAQRLNLPLVAITPPGHIFVRYEGKPFPRNIETTARGIPLPDEAYLGMELKALPKRTSKEVIGLNFINLAGIHFEKEEYDQAISYYKKGLVTLPDDPTLNQLLGYCYYLKGDVAQAKPYLKKALDNPPIEEVRPSSLVADVYQEKVSQPILKLIFKSLKEDREPILKRIDALQKGVANHPTFRQGFFYLAILHLQLHQFKQAKEALKSYYQLDPSHPTVNFFLSQIALEECNSELAWSHLEQAEKAYQGAAIPQPIKQLRQELLHLDPH